MLLACLPCADLLPADGSVDGSADSALRFAPWLACRPLFDNTAGLSVNQTMTDASAICLENNPGCPSPFHTEADTSSPGSKPDASRTPPNGHRIDARCAATSRAPAVEEREREREKGCGVTRARRSSSTTEQRATKSNPTAVLWCSVEGLG